MNSKVILVGVVSAICAVYPILVSSHGILLDPPGRSSLWRYPEFEQYEVPHNYEDNQLFCGGVVVRVIVIRLYVQLGLILFLLLIYMVS